MRHSLSRRSILSGIAVIVVFALTGSQCAQMRATAERNGLLTLLSNSK